MRIASFFGVGGCELRFAAADAVRRARQAAHRAVSSRQLDAERRVQLRRLLIAVPNWSRGHVLLARAEISLMLLSSEGLNHRLKRAVLASCQAVKVLSGKSDFMGEVEAYEQLVQALAASAVHRSAAALDAYIAFISTGRRCPGVPRALLAEAAERAAAAAASLGDKARASALLAAVPEENLSSEARLLLGHLRGTA
ncbi:MAG: hypothetical protein KDD66_03115 [Bdellovibrionales bacterium]|nr:hypothetical protein [Bdellovibrionales bacterium]